MAITRKLLESLGIESEKVSAIIEAHAETVEGLKAQIKEYKTDAEKLADTEKKLQTAEAELESFKTAGGDWQKKYEAEHAEFEDYKKGQEAKETLEAKKSAYKTLLKNAGVSANRIDSILKVTDLEKVVIKDGEVEGADKLTESIKTEWADFIASASTSGASTTTPPGNDGGTSMTKEQIMKIKDATERQKAIADNHELFGF